MFSKLIASAPGPRRWLRNPAVIIASVAAHVLVLAGIVWASAAPEEEPEPEPEQVTYIDVTEIPPPDPEEVFEAAPEDAPPQPAAADPAPRRPPAAPRNPQPTPAATDEPAGFQELEVPDLNVSGIPAPDATAAAVRPEDFGGRGAVGGSASGIPAPPAARTSERGGSGGSGDAANATYSANLVDEQVELINRSEVVRILTRRFPSELRDAGIEGRVVVQFVVDRNGRPEPGSIKIISATRQEFAGPSREAIAEFRFRPAKKQGQTVRQVVQLPVTWEVR